MVMFEYNIDLDLATIQANVTDRCPVGSHMPLHAGKVCLLKLKLFGILFQIMTRPAINCVMTTTPTRPLFDTLFLLAHELHSSSFMNSNPF
jgi:hypothetical protein